MSLIPLRSIMEAMRIITLLRLTVVFLGLIGNLISFLVFSRKSFQKNSVGIYCRALAISDSFMVFDFFLDVYSLTTSVPLPLVSKYICKFVWFTGVCLSPVSAWVLCVFSIDKMICVLNTRRFAFIKKKIFQISIIVAIVLINCAIYFVIPIKIEPSMEKLSPNETRVICDLSSLPNFKIMNGIYIFHAILIPFALMIGTTCVIVRCLIKSRKKLEENRSHEMRDRKARDVKFAKNAVILSLIFIFFEMPITSSYLVEIKDETVNLIFYKIAYFLFDCNYSIRFLTYLAFNSIFRSEFMSFFKRNNQVSIVGNKTLSTNVNTVNKGN
jgi:hypothetical protein